MNSKFHQQLIVKPYSQIKVNLPQEFDTNRSQFQHPTRQCFSFHEGRWMRCPLGLDIPARYPGGAGSASWWYDDTHAAVTASAHRAPAGIHQKRNEEAKTLPDINTR